MGIITAALRELVAAGVTGEALVTAIERVEEAAKPKRSQGALRTARWREKKASHVTSHVTDSVTVTSQASHVTLDLSPPSSPPSPPSLNNPSPSSPSPSSSLAAKRARGTGWPEGWKPDRNYARQRGFSEQRIDSEIERFRDHALAKGSTYKNWDAAWRGWVTSPYQTGTSNGARPRTTADAFDDLITRLGDQEREGGPVVEHDPC